MIYENHHALFELAPGSKWACRGEAYEDIEWLDLPIKKPTKQAIAKWIFDKNNAEPMRLLRIERDKRIAKTDWWASSDRTMTPEQIAYRQALRDITNNAKPKLLENGTLNLKSVTWPEY